MGVSKASSNAPLSTFLFATVAVTRSTRLFALLLATGEPIRLLKKLLLLLWWWLLLLLLLWWWLLLLLFRDFAARLAHPCSRYSAIDKCVEPRNFSGTMSYNIDRTEGWRKE